MVPWAGGLAASSPAPAGEGDHAGAEDAGNQGGRLGMVRHGRSARAWGIAEIAGRITGGRIRGRPSLRAWIAGPRVADPRIARPRIAGPRVAGSWIASSWIAGSWIASSWIAGPWIAGWHAGFDLREEEDQGDDLGRIDPGGGRFGRQCLPKGRGADIVLWRARQGGGGQQGRQGGRTQEGNRHRPRPAWVTAHEWIPFSGHGRGVLLDDLSRRGETYGRLILAGLREKNLSLRALA